MRVSHEDFMMGRDTIYPDELTEDVLRNSATTIERVNALLAAMEADGVPLEPTQGRGNYGIVNSGWRPAAINAQTKGAAVRSKHMTGEACDLHDPEGALDDWCMAHPDALASLGLWQEHPGSTKGWCHVQIVAPRSGNRVFYP